MLTNEQDQVPWRDFINTFCRVLQLTNELTPPMFDLLEHSRDKIIPQLELQIRCLQAVIGRVEEKDIFRTIINYGFILSYRNTNSRTNRVSSDNGTVRKGARLVRQP